MVTAALCRFALSPSVSPIVRWTSIKSPAASPWRSGCYSQIRTLFVRVVSYNILSSHLASPTHFTKCQPQHLDASTRFDKITSKIRNDIDNAQHPTVYCLQEVSRSWAGPLHVFFASRNFHFVTGLYGHSKNNYMGVAVAYPSEEYDSVTIDMARLSDHRVGGWPEEGEGSGSGWFSTILRRQRDSIIKGLYGKVVRPVRTLLRLPPVDAPIDQWKLAENRHNVMLFLRLRQKGKLGVDAKSAKQTFCIANYHMPCLYYAPMALTLHAEMASKRAQSLAEGDPYIFAGDFNFTPDSPTYSLVTSGELDKEDPSYPTKRFGIEWEISIEGMRSAYAESEHGEPDFTINSQINDEEPFIGTLDYVFLSNDWDVVDVDKLDHLKRVQGPFPNADEPSDHVMIGADLRLSIKD